jgi:putative oxygen-independent coproporphyrinogen III oxidase
MKTSLYIHYPYCLKLCNYCNFNKYLLKDNPKLLDAFLAEIHHYKNTYFTSSFSSIYFGGGTPSLASPKFIEAILSNLNLKNIEVTLEVNPSTVDYKKLLDFKLAGINRISLGIQALNDKDLLFFNRDHTVENAIKTIDIVSKVYDNYSLDFIWARPEQSFEEWKNELLKIVQLGAPHLSLYQLTVERGTLLSKLNIQLPSENKIADLYDLTRQITKEHGYLQYEASSFEKKQNGFKSQHNQSYWNGNDYVGLGPGAHGRIHIEGKRFKIINIPSPDLWTSECLLNGNGIRKKVEMNQREIREVIKRVNTRS